MLLGEVPGRDGVHLQEGIKAFARIAEALWLGSLGIGIIAALGGYLITYWVCNRYRKGPSSAEGSKEGGLHTEREVKEGLIPPEKKPIFLRDTYHHGSLWPSI